MTQMLEVPLKVNLSGRISNFHLPKSKSLIPLFEAVVNSIQSVRETGTNDGLIRIEVIYDDQVVLDIDGLRPPIKSFVITDNGSGFDEKNFDSFSSSDSRYKMEIGGKGVGRLTWLKAFNNVYIESNFKEDDKNIFMKIDFLIPYGIKASKVEIEDSVNRQTKVKLDTYLESYKVNLPKDLESLSEKIIAHCLGYYLEGDMPQIILFDYIDEIDLNKRFENMHQEADSEEFELLGNQFEIKHIKSDQTLDSNYIFLCADKRMVEKIELDKHIIDMGKQYISENGYTYTGVVTSKFLDENVSNSRDGFNIENYKNSTLPDEISKDRLVKEICKNIELKFNKELTEIRDKKIDEISNHIRKESPQFIYLLTTNRDELLRLSPKLKGKKLTQELQLVKMKHDSKVKENVDKFIRKAKIGKINSNDYLEKIKLYSTQISEINTSSLIEYVIHRKAIIGMLQNSIYNNEKGKYDLEKIVHNIFYPMNENSDTTSYYEHNLWLIDEKLAYSHYLASDQPFGNREDKSRVDILAYPQDKPVALSEVYSNINVHNSITLYELKRPMRNDYTKTDNPVQQLLDYAEKIMEGNMSDKNGRPIVVNKSTKMFLYAICDVTPTLKSLLSNPFVFKEVADGEGYYMYHEPLNAYVEIIPYSKIINDSEKKNQVFFEQLELI